MWIFTRFCSKKKKNKPNVTVAAAITTHMLHSFLVLVVVWASICSPVIQTSICLPFYWTDLHILYIHKLLVVGVMCLIWATRMGLSDGMKRGCSKEFSFRFEVSFGVRFMKSKLNLRSRLAEVAYYFLKSLNVKKKQKKKNCSARGVLFG